MNIKILLNNLFKLPVKRNTILNEVRNHLLINQDKPCRGTCVLIMQMLLEHDIDTIANKELIEYFPDFTYENASTQFGAKSDTDNFWWPRNDYKSRIKFLDWLIEHYKNDRTNLREI